MRTAIVTTALVIAALALWANVRSDSTRRAREDATAARSAPALPDVAAAPQPPAQEPIYEPAAAPRTRSHVVLADETPADLAQRYYGDPGRANEILEANRAQLEGREQLRAGETLLIP